MREITICHEFPPCAKERLRDHIYAMKDIIVPPLTGRVVLDEYISKIAQYADLFYAMDGETICGSCMVYLNQASAYITSIGVFPEYWRKGIGTKLLDEVVQAAKEKQIKEISLQVHADNKTALHFYEAYGFEIEIKNAYWIKMTKKWK